MEQQEASVGASVPQRNADNYNQWNENWKQLVLEWQASGLSQAEFCRNHTIAITTFNWWKRRVLNQVPGPKRHRAPRREGVTKPETTKPEKGACESDTARHPFIPVCVKPRVEDASVWRLEIQCRNGRVLRVGQGIEPDELNALVSALESGPC